MCHPMLSACVVWVGRATLAYIQSTIIYIWQVSPPKAGTFMLASSLFCLHSCDLLYIYNYFMAYITSITTVILYIYTGDKAHIAIHWCKTVLSKTTLKCAMCTCTSVNVWFQTLADESRFSQMPDNSAQVYITQISIKDNTKWNESKLLLCTCFLSTAGLKPRNLSVSSY